MRRAPSSSIGSLWPLLLVALNLRPALASLGPVLEPLRADLGLSYGVAGLFTSLPVICMGLFAPLAMPLVARLGIKHTVTLTLLVIALATLLRADAGVISLLISCIFAGAAIAVLGPVLGVHIKQQYSQRSARVSAWITSALCLGAALAAGCSAILERHFGWAWALSSWSLLAFIAIVPWSRSVSSVATDQPTDIPPMPWRQSRAWLLMWVFGLHGGVFYALLTWLAPAYLSYGINAVGAGQLLGVFALMQIAGTLLISALPTLQQERRPALLVSGACTLLGLLGMWFAPLLMPYLWMCLLGAGTAGLFALTLILPLDYSASPEDAGSWTAMMSGGGYVIAAAVPYLCGKLCDMTGGYTAMFAALCLLSSVVLGLCLFLRPRTQTTLV